MGVVGKPCSMGVSVAIEVGVLCPTGVGQVNKMILLCSPGVHRVDKVQEYLLTTNDNKTGCMH